MNTLKVLLASALMMLASLPGCGLVPQTIEEGGTVIYDHDDRIDYPQINDRHVMLAAQATVSVWNDWQVEMSDDSPLVNLRTRTYGTTYRLHPSERFYNQPIGAGCSGFLVGPDVVVTAGHCINKTNYKSKLIVFQYRTSRVPRPSNQPDQILKYQVYRVKEIIARRLESGYDYAVLRLDRVAHVIPMTIAKSDPSMGTELYVLGHPTGLPLKYTPGGEVLDTREGRPTFTANVDTYGGNSGSPVLNRHHEVVGILVRGATDFVLVDGYYRSNRLRTRGSTGEFITKVSVWSKYIPALKSIEDDDHGAGLVE